MKYSVKKVPTKPAAAAVSKVAIKKVHNSVTFKKNKASLLN